MADVGVESHGLKRMSASKDVGRETSDDGVPSSDVGSREDQELLAGWKEESEELAERIQVSLARRPGRNRLLTLSSVVSIVVLALLISAALYLTVGRDSTIDFEGHSEVQRNDYILDPKWNFNAPPQRREFSWTIRDHVHNPDGVFRSMILVNNQFPGPLIEVNEGDTIIVHVNNEAQNATSIHFHGIYQNGSAHMDGTVGITQCPIPPGGHFIYEFTVTGQTGTYWWHGHYGVQASDGLHGPLIVHGKGEKALQQLEYASDRVILVSDHYHDLSSALLWQYLKPDMENSEPVPNGGLLNGKYIRDCSQSLHLNCDNSSAHVGIPHFHLSSGQNHRLRFINVGAFAEFLVQIDEHELAVTEVDGTDVTPMSYHRISISPAQRYSVIVGTNAKNPDKFWLRARMNTWCFTDPPSDFQPDVLGVVEYGNGTLSSSQVPTSADWKDTLGQDCRDMNASDLRPVRVQAAPASPDQFFYIRSNFEIGAYRLSRGFFNTSSWRPNIRSPSLYRAVEGIKTNNLTFSSVPLSSETSDNAFVNDAAFDNSRELVIQTTSIQTLDILVHNFDDGNHPLHLHGYKYFVLAQGDAYPPLIDSQLGFSIENLKPLYDSLDLSNPLRRDTASVGEYGWILIRLVADNPGAWAFHCHLSWHSEAGLLMQFLTRSEELSGMQIPEAAAKICNAVGLEKGAGPDDSVYEDLAK